MEYNKEDLERMVLIENMPYSKIGKIYGVSGVTIRKKCISLGIEIPIRAKFKEDYKPHNKGKYKTTNCLLCNKEFRPENSKNVFCSNKCSSKYPTIGKINRWLENPEEYSNKLFDPRLFKPYILEDQDNKCKVCGMDNIWNGKPLIFVLDHIDGNAANNRRDNLRLVCHNCDSQLPTYKSKNKNSARTERHKYSIKNDPIVKRI